MEAIRQKRHTRGEAAERGSRTRAVIFDLDDTLYPEMEHVVGAFKPVSRYLERQFKGQKHFFDMMVEVFRAGRSKKVFNAVLEEMGLPHDQQLIATLVSIYRAHQPIIRPFPGARETMRALRTRFRVGLLTDGHLETQRKKVRALGIAQYFDRIIYTDEHGKDWWKPSRLGFEEMQRSFGLSGAQCAYIADNPLKDFYAPNTMGWLTIRVRSKDGLYARLEASGDYKARSQIDQIASVLRILENCGRG